MPQNEEATASPPLDATRRDILRKGMVGTVGLMFATALGGSLAMLWPLKQSGFGAHIRVPKRADEIKVGDVLTVREGKFYLTCTEDGFLALYWRCAHLGCTVPWVESTQRFGCPCHGAQYTITGQNVAGPAPRPLDCMPMEISAEGAITVNTGVIRQRSTYAPSQTTRWERT